jgi:actin-like ATPase involved in cell morphogenesis
LIEEPIAAAIGAGVAIEEPVGRMVWISAAERARLP